MNKDMYCSSVCTDCYMCNKQERLTTVKQVQKIEYSMLASDIITNLLDSPTRDYSRFQWRSSNQVHVQNKGKIISVTGKCTSIVQGILKLHYKWEKLQEVNSEMEISMQEV